MKIDLYDPKSYAAGHPFTQYEWLRENAPVYWHEEPNGPGYWAVTSYKHVWDVDRNFQAFSSEPTIMIQDSHIDQTFGQYKMMLMMDPPQHTAYRKLIRAEFTAPVTQERLPRMKVLARQIIDAVIEKGECDFVSEVAGEMPSYVIAEMMGLPLDDGRELYKLTEIIHTTAADGVGMNESGMAAVYKMFEYGRSVIDEKRARPKDDLATKLLNAEVDGKRLDDMEFLLFFLLLIDAGGDTTRNLLASGMIALLENPEQHAWLMADLPNRLASAREELLRWCSPVIYMRRRAKRDVELSGQKIREGQKAVMYFGAANRDKEKFARADVLDLSRSPNEHIAFGTGPHGCLGQHIARIEIDAILEEVLTRMKGFELAGAPEWQRSNFISGPKHMPVRFKPGARSSTH